MSSVDGGSRSSFSDDPQVLKFNKDCVARLQRLGGDAAEKKYLAPKTPGTTGKELPIQTNVFGIEVVQETVVYQYVVHAKADLSPTKEAVFTKKGREDFIVRERHGKCCDILFSAVDQDENFFKISEGNNLVYDGQSVLFTTMDLFPDKKEVPEKKRIFELNGSNMSNEDLKALSSIFLEIHAAKHESFTVSAEKILRRTADSNLKANNRAYTQFLELVLNQSCIRNPERFACFEHGKIFCLEPQSQGYEAKDCPDVGDGKVLLPGLKKSIQFIEGPYGRGMNNPSVVIDAMKAAFHKPQVLGEKIYEILGRDPSEGLSDMEIERVNPVIRGLHCNTTYTGRVRHVRIDGLAKVTAEKARFEMKEGNCVTVLQYFRDKYNVDLMYPNANLVTAKIRGTESLYPMELLTVDKEQRVTIPQLTSAQSQKTTKECAVVPLDRQRLIVAGKAAAEILQTNELLQAFGIVVYQDPMSVKGRELGGKNIKFGDSRTSATAQGKWRGPQGAFSRPAEWPQCWAAYAVVSKRPRFQEKDLHEFVSKFIGTCQKRGIRASNPAECECVPLEHIEAKLNHAADNGCKFVFIISEDTITHLHQTFKMIERDREMIIQDMKSTKAGDVVQKNKFLTLENVINKTNVKLGGLNHSVIDSKLSDDNLIIGVGVSAPLAATKLDDTKRTLNPLVVGYSSNAKGTQDFSGDFFLAPSGQDTIGSIEDILTRCFTTYEKYRGHLPKKVTIYRSGASEGSHAAILSYEIPLARAVLEGFSNEIKLIYMVVTKDHSYRFFKQQIDPNAKTTEQNIAPGIVLDHDVTHPACKQFFMNSHTTLQGTAKTPMYTVLADDCDASMDILEELTFALCHHHQIVALTTSLPTPLYVANEYAKRGRNLWSEKTKGAAIPYGDEGMDAALKEYTQLLSYESQSGLVDKRINA